MNTIPVKNTTPVKTPPVCFKLSLFGIFSNVKVSDDQNRIEITDRTRRQRIITMMSRFDSASVKLFGGREEVLVIVCRNKKKIVLSLDGDNPKVPHCEKDLSDILYQIQSSPVALH